MASNDTTTLDVARRDPAGSRTARRLRRTGRVPGVIYGGGEDPVSIDVDARTLRNALAHAGAVIELSIDGDQGAPAVVKDLHRHPVNGAMMHIDLLRVRLDQAIQTPVVVDLLGAEEAPGTKRGGVLEQVTRELTIEALPGDIPESIQHDVSGLEIGENVTVGELAPPRGVTIVDDPETIIATVTPPRLQVEDESEIETETEVVGEAAPEGQAEPGDADGAEASADGDAAAE